MSGLDPRYVVPLLALSSLPMGCMRFYRPGEGPGGTPAICHAKHVRWDKDASPGDQTLAALCDEDAPPADIYKQMKPDDALTAAMVVVVCGRQKAPDACDKPLGQAIRRDLATQYSGQDVSAALAAASVDKDTTQAFLASYADARKQAQALAPDGDIAKQYLHWAKARDTFWGARTDAAAQARTLAKDASGKLDDAIALRDRLVKACMQETKFSTTYCWNNHVVRPLTQSIEDAAEKKQRFDVAYVENETLTEDPGYDRPALVLDLLFSRSYSDWVPMPPEHPARYTPKSHDLFAKVDVSSAEVKQVVPHGDNATIVFKTRVSHAYMSGPCNDKLVLQDGRLKKETQCGRGSSTTDVDRTAPVKVPAEDVAGLVPGNRAYVVAPKKSKAGRLLYANPRATISADEGPDSDPPHRWRFTEVRTPGPGLP